MRLPRRSLSLLVAALVAAIVVAGCDSGAATPSPSVDPSASPIIATDAEFCGALGVLESEYRILGDIKLRPTNRRALNAQFEQLGIAWDDVRAVAPRGLRAQMNDMNWAVIDLGIAIEDYTTTAQFTEAADQIQKRDMAFDKAFGRLRARTTCEPFAPTLEPDQSASPESSPSSVLLVTPVPLGSPGVAASATPPAPSTTPHPIGR